MIQKYDLKTKTLAFVLKEDADIQDMQVIEKGILYAMYGTGFVLFEPETMNKTWLLGYKLSAWMGINPPRPPKEYKGEPLMGHTESHLWPFAMDHDRLFTLGWSKYDVLLHESGSAFAKKSMFDGNAGYVSNKHFLAHNQYGLWITTEYGEVYLLKRVGEEL